MLRILVGPQPWFNPGHTPSSESRRIGKSASYSDVEGGLLAEARRIGPATRRACSSRVRSLRRLNRATAIREGGQ